MREKLIELLDKIDVYDDWFDNGYIAEQLIDNGVTIPVRCKDCRHWEECESSLVGKVMCCTGQGFARIQKLPEDFCSCGERRTDE